MKPSAIEQMESLLKTQVKEAIDSMAEAKQYGQNSAGYNAYMGQMEMAQSMLEQCRQLRAQEAQEQKAVIADCIPAGFAICSECGGEGYVLEKSGMGEEQEPSTCLECRGKGLIALKSLGLPTPTVAADEGGLVEELLKYLNYKRDKNLNYTGHEEEFVRGQSNEIESVLRILQRHNHYPLDSHRPVAPVALEPLAVLADRKGLRLTDQYESDGIWYIWFCSGKNPKKGERVVSQTNYAACESKARKYLEGLPDIK